METPNTPNLSDQKSKKMRARLMDATLDVIVKSGWAGATTPKICQSASVSRGAQTHHFPTKSALFLSAIERVTAAYEIQLIEQVNALDADQRSLRAVLSIFWETFIDDRFLHSSVEAIVAARTDPDLRKTVLDLDIKAIATMRSLAAYIIDSSASLDQLQDVLELSLYYFRGTALQRGVHSDEQYRQRLFEMWCDMAERSL